MRGAGSIIFIVYQFWYGGEPLREEFRDLCGCSRRWAVAPGAGEWMLSGRLCEGIQAGETLFTWAGSALTVKGLFAYGRRFDRLDAGMTCGLLVSPEPGTEPAARPGREGASQFLWRSRMQENRGTPAHIY